MKQKHVRPLLMLFVLAISACGSTDAIERDGETQVPQPDAAEVVVPADVLRTIEELGAELDTRQRSAALTAEWQEAWSSAQFIRRQSEVEAFIAHIQEASSGEELTVRLPVLELYFQSHEPIFVLLERQHENGTLDARLTELRMGLQGGQVTAQRTFCCRVTTWSDEISCREYDTFGAWAWRKCMGFLPWTAKSRQLFSDSCSNVQGC